MSTLIIAAYSVLQLKIYHTSLPCINCKKKKKNHIMPLTESNPTQRSASEQFKSEFYLCPQKNKPNSQDFLSALFNTKQLF